MEAKEHQPHCTGVFNKDTKYCTCDKQQSNAQSSREKLMQELRKVTYDQIDVEDIAIWVEKDRERICEQVKEIIKIVDGEVDITNEGHANTAMKIKDIAEKILQRAGIDV